jgi:hypothetical protein
MKPTLLDPDYDDGSFYNIPIVPTENAFSHQHYNTVTFAQIN